MNRQSIIERTYYDVALFAAISFLIWIHGPITIQTLLFFATGWIGVDVFKLVVNRD